MYIASGHQEWLLEYDFTNWLLAYDKCYQTNVIHVCRIINSGYVIQIFRFSSETYEVSYVTRVYRPGMRSFRTTLLSASVRVETSKTTIDPLRGILNKNHDLFDSNICCCISNNNLKKLKYTRILINKKMLEKNFVLKTFLFHFNLLLFF